MGTFRVKSTMAMRERSAFALIGTVLETPVEAGMFLRVALNHVATYVIRIQSIEMATASSRTDVALIVEADQEEQDFWRTLGVEGELLEVTQAGPQ
jgi:hypothetical protein